MDEATASIDLETDARVQEILREDVEKKKCTVITIAHRIQTIVKNDKILVLDDGEILEFGKKYLNQGYHAPLMFIQEESPEN